MTEITQLSSRKEKYLYLMLSSTHNRVGSFIRAATSNFYNHSAITLDGNLTEFYSFARFWFDTTFHGGFVTENTDRYILGDYHTPVALYALPITDEEEEKIKKIIAKCKAHPERFDYNLISAAAVPLKKRINIPNSYTCIEFIADLIAVCMPEYGLKRRGFYTFRDFQEIFKPFLIYTGPFPDAPVEGDYFTRHSMGFIAKSTVSTVSRLLWRWIKI